MLAGNSTGTKVKTEVKKEFYENGNVRKITKTRIRKTKQFELSNFYRRTAITVTEFSENGTPISREKHITKIGDTGRPCYEVVTVKRTYHANGKMKTYDKWICDKRKGIYKEYDMQGKRIYKRKEKQRR